MLTDLFWCNKNTDDDVCKSEAIQHNTNEYKVMTQEHHELTLRHHIMHEINVQIEQNLGFWSFTRNAATSLWQGRKYDRAYVTNLVIFPSVKKFWKSVNIWSHKQSGT